MTGFSKTIVRCQIEPASDLLLAQDQKKQIPQGSTNLYKAIVSVLQRALECCLDPAPDFRDPRSWFQGIEEILRAYQREGLPCQRCGRAIRRIEQGGRSTYCCLHCQK